MNRNPSFVLIVMNLSEDKHDVTDEQQKSKEESNETESKTNKSEENVEDVGNTSTSAADSNKEYSQSS